MILKFHRSFFLNSDEGDWDLVGINEVTEEDIQKELERANHEPYTAVDENWNSIE